MDTQDGQGGTSGIPTVYLGRQFRSRLEARWAAFFDLVGWPYEYEPFDLDGWIPDFLLLGQTKVLVEVKPVTELPQDVADKIDAACPPGVYSCGDDPPEDQEVLILGCTIAIEKPSRYKRDGEATLGWLREHGDWERAILGKPSDWDFCHEYGYYGCRMSGWYEGRYPHFDLRAATELLELWNRAGNAVQWRAPRRA